MWHKFFYGALAFIALGLIVVLVQKLERYEEPVDRGWSDAAMSNPYLAAEQFLGAHNLLASRSDRTTVVKALSLNSVLLIADPDLLSNAILADELEEWVLAGGHAIVAAPWFVDDSLTSRFDVYRLRDEKEMAYNPRHRELSDIIAEAREKAIVEAEQAVIQRETIRDGWGLDELLRRLESLTESDNLTRLTFVDDDRELLIDFGDVGTLHRPEVYVWDDESYAALYEAGNAQGPTFMQLDVGSGMLTIMVHMEIWDSTQIGLFDHAHLLRRLVQDADEVVFLSGAISPSLMDLMWKYYPELLLALLLWLGAWLMYRSRRFGPVLALHSEGRRSFVEHIEAVGHFMWRQKKSQELLDEVRMDLWQAVQHRFPNSETLSDSARLAALVQHTQFETSELHKLMFGPAPDDEVQFFHMVKSLQKIRKAL